MNPLKTQSPAHRGSRGNTAGKIQITGKEDTATNAGFQDKSCFSCCWYREIPLRGAHIRHLCMFSGQKEPMPGEADCGYIQGRWEDIDQILGLLPNPHKAMVEIPNYTRPCNSLAVTPSNGKIVARDTDIHSLADNKSKWIDDIGWVQRPHVGDTAVASCRLGSVGTRPFCFNP